MLDLAQVRAVTFDCYGTLVDWRAGMRPVIARALVLDHPPDAPLPSVEQWWERWEALQFERLAPYRPYREVLLDSFAATMRSFGLPTFADGGPALVHSLADWPPFPDTTAALRRIARRRRLGVISNVDGALLAQTLGRLLAPIGVLVTAEEAKAYKPDPAPFQLALERLGLRPDEVLHAAFGWRYDLETAARLGMRTCFVRRDGAPPPTGSAAPDLDVPSLRALAERLEP